MINHAWGKDHIVNNTCTNGLVNYLVVFQSLTLSIPDERHSSPPPNKSCGAHLITFIPIYLLFTNDTSFR